MRHTVAICTAGRMAIFPTTLESLREALADARDCDVLIVDNGPVGEAQAVREVVRLKLGGAVPWRVMRYEVPGLARARNLVLDSLSADCTILSFLDDDAAPCGPGWRAAIREVFDTHPTVGLVCGPIVMVQPTARDPWWRTWKTDALFSCTPRDQRDGPMLHGSVPGANASYRVEAIRELRFVEALGVNLGLRRPLVGEDEYLNEQIAERGWDAWFTKAAAVRHHIGAERYHAAWLLRRAHTAGRTLAVFDEMWARYPERRRGGMARSFAVSSARSAAAMLFGRTRGAFFHACEASIALGYWQEVAMITRDRRMPPSAQA